MSGGENPHVGPVVDLVNPYITPDTVNTGGSRILPGSEYAQWWMREHPGRWAKIGEGQLGISKHIAERMGYETGIRGGGRGETFARVPHPEGEPLAAALERRRKAERLDLPELVRSAFDWTVEELAEAAAVARENLFPVATKRSHP